MLSTRKLHWYCMVMQFLSDVLHVLSVAATEIFSRYETPIYLAVKPLCLAILQWTLSYQTEMKNEIFIETRKKC